MEVCVREFATISAKIIFALIQPQIVLKDVKVVSMDKIVSPYVVPTV